jgi:hypothetical protein
LAGEHPPVTFPQSLLRCYNRLRLKSQDKDIR